jgi:hypothetical protein
MSTAYRRIPNYAADYGEREERSALAGSIDSP